MGEYEANLLRRETETQVGILSLHNVYGTHCDFSEERAQVIPSLVHRRLTNPKKDLVVWGNGEQGRAFVHVRDVVSALLGCADKGMNQGVIQIGPDECTSIKVIAQEVMRAIPGMGSLKFDTSKPVGDIGRSCNYEKALRLLGWRPTVSISDGIDEMARWMRGKI